VAQRVAFEQKVKIGEEVGYAIRFEDVSNHKTRIKFVTDGILLRECMVDPLLNSYDIIILDEAHERSLQTDILMGLLRQAQEKRPSLRVVVMSATLQTELYMRFFKDGNVIKIAGRQFPVDVLYATQAVDDYVDAALLTCLQIHADEEPGGVLIFLPGQEDIEALAGLLEDHLPSLITTNHKSKSMDSDIAVKTVTSEPAAKKMKSSDTTITDGVEVIATSVRNFEIAPLYAAMSAEDQMTALRPSSQPTIRKFVLSTNIAETSVTIAGIKYGMLQFYINV
jgi:ATP-dependent RNA helicase DHX8/PRP22